MIKGLWFFIHFSWQHEKRYLIYRIANQFIISMIPIVAVIMPRFIINELMGAQRSTQLLLYIGILIGYTFAASAISNWLGWAGFTYRIKVAQAFMKFLYEKTIHADYADIESSRYLEMKEKAEKFLFGDLRGFSYVLDMAVEIIGKAFTLIGVIAVVASLNPMIVMIFIALVLISSFVEGRVQRKQADMQLSLTLIERKGMYYGELVENFSYGKELRLNNLGSWLLGRKEAHDDYAFDTYKKNNSLGIKSGIFNSFISLIQQAISYAYLVAQFLGGHITIGDFTMFVGGVTAFSGAMRGLMQNIVEVYEYRKYYDAIEEYLNIPAKMRNNRRLPVPTGKHQIEFRNVSFAYPGQKGYALRNINITLEPGQKLSIVGENGAGKSTFVKLLCRIYDPTEGEILLDGVDIRDIDFDAYMALFGAVFQDYKLYALSLKDNVALSQSDLAEDSAVEAVLRKAGFGDKLDSLPKGVQTLVYRNFDGEGFEPSGGEGQKIALARALFKDAPIAILDEPTAALDPRAEFEMYKQFDALVAGKTAVYISHRLSSARFCDVIAVFSNGEVIQYGGHDDLIKVNGVYAELFNMQAQFYIIE
ncbi:MAG: ABC transporter ATP-binding protein/permease [Defluviitaleaceae bacterium]|nr:ABC transporter ATP-binding protein/permease [Defluviitaleaceae bacterium]